MQGAESKERNNTGQPILYSAMLLRRALGNIVNELDPNGKDPALCQMVVMGHSQGGLLTKLMTVKSRSRFWENVNTEPFDEVQMPQETRQLLRDAEFFDPVPDVKRVVFMATPHRTTQCWNLAQDIDAVEKGCSNFG